METNDIIIRQDIFKIQIGELTFILSFSLDVNTHDLEILVIWIQDPVQFYNLL